MFESTLIPCTVLVMCIYTSHHATVSHIISDDIEVIFYEERHDSALHPVQPWTAKGRFGPNDVHHQVYT